MNLNLGIKSPESFVEIQIIGPLILLEICVYLGEKEMLREKRLGSADYENPPSVLRADHSTLNRNTCYL